MDDRGASLLPGAAPRSARTSLLTAALRVGEEASTCLIPSNATNVDADIDVITERRATHQLGRVPVAWKMTRVGDRDGVVGETLVEPT